jgi:DNA-binding beta-propeller fold protein YncE
LQYILLLIVGILLSACNGTTPVKDKEIEDKRVEIVFPPSPEEPRFYYEMTLFHSAQLSEQSKESRWREFLTGENTDVSGEGLSKPYDVTACGGRVYISDTVRRHIAVFDFREMKYFTIGTEEPGFLRKPLGLDTDANCNVYVADISLGSIMIYDSEGTYISAIGSPEWFHRLSHVAVDEAGERLYAVDTGGVQTEEHRVRVFDIGSAEHLFDIGPRGKEEGQFNLPRDIDIGPDGRIHIVDSGNFRVQVFDREGNFIRTFGSVGNRTGQFSRPKGIATDPEGNIYVADTSLANFQIFNAEGQLLMFVGNRTNKSQPAGYMLPSGIDVDADGRVYFVDQFYRKVDIYRPASLPAEEGDIGRAIFRTSPDQ